MYTNCGLVKYMTPNPKENAEFHEISVGQWKCMRTDWLPYFYRSWDALAVPGG